MDTNYDTEHTNDEYKLRHRTYERWIQTTTQNIRTMDTNYDTEHTNDEINYDTEHTNDEYKLRNRTYER